MGSTVDTRIEWHTANAAVAHPRPSVATRWLEHWSAVLSRPTFGRLHGRCPIETTRIATTPGAEAVRVLDRTDTIAWGRGRSAGHLRLDPLRVAPSEFGRPWIADATLHGRGPRRLRVSVAIFDFGTGRCGIQIRPRYRRPWSCRRLRRCLRSTHAASERLRQIVLAVDFTPPGQTVTADVALRSSRSAG